VSAARVLVIVLLASCLACKTHDAGSPSSELVPALVSIDGGERRGSTGLARYVY
jgi:hypothetical protein